MLNNRRFALVSLLFVLFGSAVVTSVSAQKVSRIQAEKPAIARFVQRWNDPSSQKLLADARSKMTDDTADRDRSQIVLRYLDNFTEALKEYQNGDLSALDYVGGLKAFKKAGADWLTDKERSVRALGAVALGISGDAAFAPQLAKLVNDTNEPDADNPRYDRGCAATALGMLNAKQYLAKLAAMLSNPNEFDRGGAALGLGFLKAKKFELAIGRLLHDKNLSVQTAAEDALTIMDAKTQAAVRP
jgi:hypothetical protein